MNRRPILAAATLLLGVTVAWFWWHGSAGRVAPGPTSDREDRDRSHALATAIAPVMRPVVDPTAYVGLHAPETSPRDDLRIVGALLRNYLQSVVGPAAPPLGFNEEIVRALRGANPQQLVFLPANHPAIDRRGELCDRWGTPYFFHPLSATDIEIRTAGPDRKLFTADDLVGGSAGE